jgi:hypothetical protein
MLRKLWWIRVNPTLTLGNVRHLGTSHDPILQHPFDLKEEKRRDEANATINTTTHTSAY